MDLTSYTSKLSFLNNILAQWLSDFNAQLPWGEGRACEMCVSLSSCRISNSTDLGWGLESAFLQASQAILTQGSQQKPSYLVPRPKASNTHFLHHRCAHVLMTLFLAAMNLCPE